jgi:hypothetical protein
MKWTMICAMGGLAIGAALLPRPASAQALNGFDVYRSNCSGCHELYEPGDKEWQDTREKWEKVLNKMVKEKGASLNKQEFTSLLNYLDSFNYKPKEIQWVETPAKSHKVSLTPADAGKLPAGWVDLTIGADERAQIPWSVQADPATKAAYIQPARQAAENQYPALIDNSGIVESGSLTTRFQIVSGKGSLGAGVIFGFRNPQSYYGVRIGAKDLVLYEVQGGQRALLARAAVPLQLKQWQTLAVDVSGKDVKVSLNGKPVPELAKKIESYKGGRLGIHTQSDTVALFDQWQVTVK